MLKIWSIPRYQNGPDLIIYISFNLTTSLSSLVSHLSYLIPNKGKQEYITHHSFSSNSLSPINPACIFILSKTLSLTSSLSISIPMNPPCVAPNSYPFRIPHILAISPTPRGMKLGMLHRNENEFNPAGRDREAPVASTLQFPTPDAVVISVSAMNSREL